jgi:hypothetical protein
VANGGKNYRPNYAIDGLVASGSKRFYQSKKEVQPWFQLEFVKEMVVLGVIFTNRKDCCGERFKNVVVHVGDQPAKAGALLNNPECTIFVGPSATGRIEHIYCTKPLMGRYLQVQLRDDSASHLHINEIEVIYSEGKNKTEKASSHKPRTFFLNLFTFVYFCLLLFTFVYFCLLLFTFVYFCLLLFTFVYFCLLLFTFVYFCLLLFTFVYFCLLLFTFVYFC